MPLPSVDENGLLPIGVFVADGLVELEAAFGGNKRRDTLIADLRKLIAEKLVFVAYGLDLHIVGSFVTNNPLPNDLDICVTVPLAEMGSRGPFVDLANREGGKGKIWEDYHVEMSIRIPDFGSDMLEYFKQLGEKEAARRGLSPGLRRGIVKVNLWERG